MSGSDAGNEVSAMFLFVGIPLMIVLFFVGRECGWGLAMKTMQQEAVRKEHAEYVTNSEGKPVWRWKQPQQ